MIDPEEYAAKNQTEFGQQAALFIWAAIEAQTVLELNLLHAIPNGGLRDKITASRLKMSGVRAGVPDVSLPVARHGYHGLYIEMKRANGRESAEQDKWSAWLRLQGYKVETAYSYQRAKEIIQWYLVDPFTMTR